MGGLAEIGHAAHGILGMAVVTGISALVCLCIYRLLFHPYARHPGPFLAKLTSWYSVYHAYHADTHVHIWRLHQKYGDIVRYAPNRIVINNGEVVKEIYSHGKNTQKSKCYLAFSVVKGAVSLLVMCNKQQHRTHRRILNQGLGDTQMRAADVDIQRVAAEFADGVGQPLDRFHDGSTWVTAAHDGWSEPKNMAHWADYFTFDVMSHFTFGQAYGMLKMATNHWILDAVAAYTRRASFLIHMPELEILGLHHVFFPGVLAKTLHFSLKSKEIMEITQARVKHEREAGIKMKMGHRDLFSSLATATDPETDEGFSQAQLWANSNLLIVAGSDTSSTGVAATFFYLSRHPDAYARVCAEVRAAFPHPDDLAQGPQLAACTYLRACIQESIRLTPPGGGPLWREAMAGGLPVATAGIHIPAGCEVGTCVFARNHDPDAFPEPMTFMPERWLATEVGEEVAARARAAFITFSVGPRNCPGKALAMVEMAVAVAAVLLRCDFRRAEGPLGDVGEGRGDLNGTYYCKDSFTSIKDGPYIQFKPVRS